MLISSMKIERTVSLCFSFHDSIVDATTVLQHRYHSYFSFSFTRLGLFSQQCKVLGTYYFRLLDSQNNHVVEEVQGKDECGIGSGRIVVAHEVAFDAKGKQSCNHSM